MSKGQFSEVYIDKGGNVLGPNGRLKYRAVSAEYDGKGTDPNIVGGDWLEDDGVSHVPHLDIHSGSLSQEDPGAHILLIGEGSIDGSAIFLSADNIVFDAGPVGRWQDYDVDFVGLDVGNGTVSAKYTMIGTCVTVQVSVDMGDSSRVTGEIFASLPANPSPEAGHMVGSASYLDAFKRWHLGGCRIRGDKVSLIYDDNSGDTTNAVGKGSPIDWGARDVISFSITYECEDL